MRYYQVTGELSGVGQSPLGFEYVYGPIDANGVDQSSNSASPRFGLRGIPFRLIYPAKGWNGRLIVFRPGGDGGTGSGHYLYQSITDEACARAARLRLLRHARRRHDAAGLQPDSSSGSFWKLAPPFWAPPSEAEHPAFVPPCQDRQRTGRRA